MRFKKVALFGLLLILTNALKSQSLNSSPFQAVEVSDSFKLKLLPYTYVDTVDFLAKSHLLVFNLINRKNFILTDGIFSFQGIGPHFPRRIFIYNKGKSYIFKSTEISGVLNEFLCFLELINISEQEKTEYLKAISNYMCEEVGQTYGIEIIKIKMP